MDVADRQGRLILRDIDVTVPDAAITLIVGRNGAGKSTLLDAMSGLVRPAKGTIHYDDRSLWLGSKLSVDVLRSIGNVFQYPEQQLFAPTVERELAYSLRYLKLPRAEVVRRTIISLEHMRLPERLLRETPHLLSGGQKRRVALASTIIAQPRWLMLDEPTAGLDAEGVTALLEFVEYVRSRGCGVVIATHDLETLLPLADQIVVLQAGRVVTQITRDKLAELTIVLQRAGLDVPISLKMADRLRQSGVRIDSSCPRPQELAAALVRHDGTKAASGSISKPDSGDTACSQPSSFMLAEQGLPVWKSDEQGSSNVSSVVVSSASAPHFLTRLDPRAKWLFYMMLSIGILIQKHWLGLFASMVIAGMIVIYARVPFKTMAKVTFPLALLLVVSALITGVGFDGGFRLELTSSSRTLFELMKIWIVSMLGLAFALTTSQLMMKQAIEQSLRFLQHLRLPVGAIALGASLMLRFIPVLAQEYRRFSKIVKARSKEHVHKDGIGFRQLPPLMIPLILSLFQIASDLTTAMQARGLRSFHIRRTASSQLKMAKIDWIVGMLGLLLFVLLVCLDAFLF
jgi:energy-coupling factor transport system ATP-binding protein